MTVRVGVAALAFALVGACASSRTDTGGGVGGTNARGGESFGTLPSPCGAGNATGATDQGVTDTGIAIGYGDDRGFPAAPGLTKEMGDAVKAMIDWCNDQGGINGRKIVGHQYDAAYSQAATVMQQACKQDFMLVGHGFALDETAEQFRIGCNLPSVPGYTIGRNATMGPMKFQAVPAPVDHYNAAPFQLAAETIPGFKTHVDIVLSTSPSVTIGNDITRNALTGMGYNPLGCGITLNQEGEPSYLPFAEKIKACGARVLISNESPRAAQFSFLESLKLVGASPAILSPVTWYNSEVAQWNIGAGDNVYIGLQFQPFENADRVPAVQKYLEIVRTTGGRTALLGMQATSSFLLWATAAKECGSNLTRQCMVTGLSRVREWTGGGLHAVTDPGGNMWPSCAVLVRLTGHEWRQVAPQTAGEFTCDPKYLQKTETATWGVQLNEDRIATRFLTPDVIKPQR